MKKRLIITLLSLAMILKMPLATVRAEEISGVLDVVDYTLDSEDSEQDEAMDSKPEQAPLDVEVVNTVSNNMVSDKSVSDNEVLLGEDESYDMVIEDGIAQPVFNGIEDFTDDDYTNEDKLIYRLCVYVETDHDTDADGMDDLVKVFLQVPRLAVL